MSSSSARNSAAAVPGKASKPVGGPDQELTSVTERSLLLPKSAAGASGATASASATASPGMRTTKYIEDSIRLARESNEIGAG